MNFKILIWAIAFILIISTVNAGFDLYDNVTIHYNLTVNQTVKTPLYCNFTGGECYSTAQLASVSQWSNNSDNASKLEDQTSGYYLNTTQEGDLNVNKSSFWDDLDSPSDITGLLMSQIVDIWTTVVESITSTDAYLILSGSTGNVTGSINESKINETATALIVESNTSLKGYVDSQDLIFNSSIKNYTDDTFITQANEGNLNVNSSQYTNVENLEVNATQIQTTGGVLGIISSWLTGLFYQKDEVYNMTEIDAQQLVQNNTISDVNTRVDDVNNTMVASNTSMKEYVDSQDIIFNDSMKDYVNANNASVVSFIGTNNDSIVALIDLNNDTMRDYVDTNNASMKSYIDEQDITFNDSARDFTIETNTTLKEYADDTFISKSNESLLNVNSSGYATNALNTSQLNDQFSEFYLNTSTTFASNITGAWNTLVLAADSVDSSNILDSSIVASDIGTIGACSNICTDADTNESTRFDNLVGTECDPGDYYNNITLDGTPQCGTPTGGATGNIFNQSLNTTDNVVFNRINVSDIMKVEGLIYAYLGLYSLSDIYTTGAGDDLWLGSLSQPASNFRAYASGYLNVSEDVCIDGGNCLSNSLSLDNQAYLNVSTSQWSNNTDNASKLNDQEGSYYLDNTNCSVDQDCDTILYTTDESNLDVNSSNYWDTADTTNSTVFNIIAGELGVLMSLWEGLFYSILNPTGFFDDITNITGTYTDTNLCRADTGNSEIDCDIVDSSTNWNTAYGERGSQIGGTSLTWDGSELDVDDDFVKIAGDDMTGNLAMGGNNITNATALTFVNDNNHAIEDNVTCIIIRGDTTIFSIC